MAEPTKAPALTSPVDFIVPNQDLFERVIDARLAAHTKHEEAAHTSEEETAPKSSTRSRTTSTPAKEDDKS
jgi:hypothetical protein